MTEELATRTVSSDSIAQPWRPPSNDERGNNSLIRNLNIEGDALPFVVGFDLFRSDEGHLLVGRFGGEDVAERDVLESILFSNAASRIIRYEWNRRGSVERTHGSSEC